MFSSRLHAKIEVNRVTSALARLRADGIAVLDLTESNPTAAGFHYDEAATVAALGQARALRYEPTPWGLPEAREAVAGYYAARGYAVPPEGVMLTASTSEAYAFLFKLLCDPGDEVLVPRPSYPLFAFLAELECVRVAQYPLFYDHGWHVDTHGLARLVTPRTRAIVLVNPNNPTGSYLKASEYAAITAVCAEHGLALISDEVFADYPFEEDVERISFAASRDQVLVFSLSGLSKVAGLPQVKLGWLVVNGPASVVEAASARLELIADTYLSVGTPVQTAAARLLASGAEVAEQIRMRTRANLEHLRQAVTGTAFQLLRIEGGWYATLRCPRVRTEEEWVLGLLEGEHVLVQPGYFFDFESEAFLVLSLLTRESVFREGVARLIRTLESATL